MPILAYHRQLVNDAILSMGIDPEVCQEADNPNVWKLHRGDAQVILVAQDSINQNSDPMPTISMMSPVIQVPKGFEDLPKLHTFLLEANHKLITESFSVSNHWVILSTTYFLEDIRRQELVQLLDSLSYYAQSFIGIFKEQFGLEQIVEAEE